MLVQFTEVSLQQLKTIPASNTVAVAFALIETVGRAGEISDINRH